MFSPSGWGAYTAKGANFGLNLQKRRGPFLSNPCCDALCLLLAQSGHSLTSSWNHASSGYCDEAAKAAWGIAANIAELQSLLRQ